METNARHILMGLFTLAVAAAGFAFVYWIKGSGGLGTHAQYTVQYERSVAGLLTGSPVLFNGKRVGEVMAIDLVPENPNRILVKIAVARETPVRADTKAGIDFQGLTGAPVVSLEGGSATAPLLITSSGETSVLIADKSAGETVSASARQMMNRIDLLITDNQDAVRSTISNLSKFTEALGRNSNRVDGILAGIERMTGGNKPAPGIYDLAPVQPVAKAEKQEVLKLFVVEPTAAFSMSQDKIMVRKGSALSDFGQDNRWSDPLVTLFQMRLIQSFENSGYLGQVTRPVEGAIGASQLAIDIRHFEFTPSENSSGEIEFSVRLSDPEGKIVGAKIFKASQKATSDDVAAAASALNQAFASTLPEVIAWTASLLKPQSKRS